MSAYEHRKSKMTVRLCDNAGHPLANAAVPYTLQCHEFLFGCGAFDTLPATAPAGEKGPDGTPALTAGQQAFYRDRVDKWLGVFNYGTLPFYWGQYEPTEGHPLTESRMRAARFLRGQGVQVKGHPLCWHTVCADWLLEYDNKTILQKQLDRIQREVSTFRGVVDIWDVINEVINMPVYTRENAVTRLCRWLGPVELVKQVFAAARQANPEAVLLINDYNLSDKYRDLIAACLDAGVPISAIGLQTHQHQGCMGKERLEEVLDRFAVFGLPLHFTENTLLSGPLMPAGVRDWNSYHPDPWPTTPEGEERQRREWKEMLELLFAHPLVQAVTAWDFADGAWMNAPSGLVRADNTPKPSYRELQRLIREEWTSRGVLHTDENGMAELAGFRGLYRLETEQAQGQVRLTAHPGTPVTRVTLDPLS